MKSSIFLVVIAVFTIFVSDSYGKSIKTATFVVPFPQYTGDLNPAASSISSSIRLAPAGNLGWYFNLGGSVFIGPEFFSQRDAGNVSSGLTNLGDRIIQNHALGIGGIYTFTTNHDGLFAQLFFGPSYLATRGLSLPVETWGATTKFGIGYSFNDLTQFGFHIKIDGAASFYSVGTVLSPTVGAGINF